jgi:hypothetical protein
MGKYIWCIKKNDGVTAHGRYDEALEMLCLEQLEAANKISGADRPGGQTGKQLHKL